MTDNIERLGELYKLLMSGDYLYDDTVSFLDFIKILRVIKTHRSFSKCFKYSHIDLASFLGIIEFLQNINVVNLTKKNKRFRIQNVEILDPIHKVPSRFIMALKLIRKIPLKYTLNAKLMFLKEWSLLRLYKPKFVLNVKSFQLPCSIQTSIKRTLLIAENTCFSSQKALFIGDDDLVSILCKFLIPELSITVIEIDGRITKLLKKLVQRYKFKNFRIYNLNFKEINEIPEIINQNYSIIHLDPPYEAKELQSFFSNINLILDDKINQIFLNGLFDNKSMSILNQFVAVNDLIITKYYKGFNSYPFKTLDSKYLKYLKKKIRFENLIKFSEKNLRKITFSSDLYLIEKGWVIKD
ncbi:MAG: bis-aminopropyl spermidine synthase family protein [Promethearchaeota archaeon]